MINSRDYDADAPAEDIGHYGDGGWFPIYIEDLFGDRRYKILNKLGFGGTATVWAARDLRYVPIRLDFPLALRSLISSRKDTIVSIKVIMAEDSHNNQELRILQHIQQGPCHLGREHLPQLLDYFYEERYGKKNLFLVLELLGPEVSAFTEIAPEFVPSASRLFCKQLLLAIDCLHSYGIIHGGKLQHRNYFLGY
jgi:serine/threonine protein kinase